MRSIKTHNPSNEVFLQEYTLDTSEQIEQKLEQASVLFQEYALHSLETRQDYLRKLAYAVEQNVEKLAKIATEEMGKPIQQARAEVKKCATVCHYYADHAVQLMAPQVVDLRSEVHLEPLGPVLAIMPWNFPYWQVFRVLAPAILLGNPVLLKHAENVWGCAHAMHALVLDAGLPPATLQPLNIPVEEVAPILNDPRVQALTFTGSEHAGRTVAAQAAQALKPFVLELGGSDPFIVLQDADLSAAVDAAVVARFQNSGQSCVAAKRIIVEAPIYDAFVRRYANAVRQLTCDDPVFESTDIGPLARADLRDNLERQVRETIGYGARCVVGGTRGNGKGFYFEPTVLADVRETMVPYREEIFGPVASISVAQDLEDALRLANATPFGLGAALWTQRQNTDEIVTRIQAGMVSVNGVIASDPRLPFGGIKNSGIGRELSVHGLYAFANIKTVRSA